MNPRIHAVLKAAALVGLGVLGGYALFTWHARTPSPATTTPAPSSAPASGPSGDRKVLYWYDPMVPQQKFDKPGKSPFMDMELVPKHADASAGQAGVAIDPRATQALGWRTAVVQRQRMGGSVQMAGTVQLNERDVALVQARAAGFVESVAALAPGDVVRSGARLADILVPEWAGAQQEYLAVRATGNAALTQAARQRLKLLGMPEALISQVERSGKVAAIHTVTAPRGGLVEELMVRQGMTVSPGMTLARLNGLDTVWIEAALPQAQAQGAKMGQTARVEVPALGGKPIEGKVSAVLPQANAATRTLRLRIEVPNSSGLLRAGMFATVTLAGDESEMLVVPSEAVIRTGRRAVVYVLDEPGKFRPVQVQVGSDLDGESDELTSILSGLEEGQQVVASGQFLLDSEASMQGLLPTAPASSPQANGTGTAPKAHAVVPHPVLHRGTGTITEIGEDGITLDHGPIPSIQWGAMVMTFPLARPELARGRKVGERVDFTFTSTDEGTVLQEVKPSSAAMGSKGAKP